MATYRRLVYQTDDIEALLVPTEESAGKDAVRLAMVQVQDQPTDAKDVTTVEWVQDEIDAATNGMVVDAVNTGSANGVGLYRGKDSNGKLKIAKIYGADAKVTVTAAGTDSTDVTIGINPGSIDHQDLSGKGTNTHDQIDTHIGTSSIHTSLAAASGSTSAIVASSATQGTGTTAARANHSHNHGDLSGSTSVMHSMASISGLSTAIADATTTAQNIGTATGSVGLFKAKSGTKLQFKKIAPGAHTTVYDDTTSDTVQININPSGIDHDNLLNAVGLANRHEDIDNHIDDPKYQTHTGLQMEDFTDGGLQPNAYRGTFTSRPFVISSVDSVTKISEWSTKPAKNYADGSNPTSTAALLTLDSGLGTRVYQFLFPDEASDEIFVRKGLTNTNTYEDWYTIWTSKQFSPGSFATKTDLNGYVPTSRKLTTGTGLKIDGTTSADLRTDRQLTLDLANINHNSLKNANANNAHSISNITNLQSTLDSLQTSIDGKVSTSTTISTQTGLEVSTNGTNWTSSVDLAGNRFIRLSFSSATVVGGDQKPVRGDDARLFSTTFWGKSGEVLAYGDPVCFGTDGKLFKAKAAIDTTNPWRNRPVGICTKAATAASQDITVVCAGVITNISMDPVPTVGSPINVGTSGGLRKDRPASKERLLEMGIVASVDSTNKKFSLAYRFRDGNVMP